MYPKGGKKMKIKPRTRRPAAPAVVYPNTRKRDNTFCNKEYSPPPLSCRKKEKPSTTAGIRFAVQVLAATENDEQRQR